MIIHVCEATATALGRENTYVATDSDEIAEVVQKWGFRCLMTSESCLTGTDRLAEAVRQLGKHDIIINVQGDEPMVQPDSIRKVLNAKIQSPGCIINGMAKVGAEEDPHSRNMPKVVVTESNRLLYMSRVMLPAAKKPDVVPETVWKQVCIYAFEPEHLERFYSFARKSFNENYEDIEILRFLDLDIPVKMIELPAATYAVDAPCDVAVVEAAIQSRDSAST